MPNYLDTSDSKSMGKTGQINTINIWFKQNYSLLANSII